MPLFEGRAFTSSSEVRTTVAEVGTVEVTSGAVAVADPIMSRYVDCVIVPVPSGRHRVFATSFVHTYDDGRERTFVASVSMVVAEGERATRELLREATGGSSPRAPDEMHWISVDAAACGFADAARIEAAMNGPAWEAFISEDLPRQPLPWVLAMPGGGDLVAVESGLGDGGYPVFGDYDTAGSLLAVHVNFALATRDDRAGVALP